MESAEMQVVALDAKAWQAPEDFYTAVATGLGAGEVRDPAALVEAVKRAQPPFRIEIANLYAAGEEAMDSVYAAFGALTLAGAKTRIGKDGLALIAMS